MNKFVSVLVLGSALALSACGGDSDSSGSKTVIRDPAPTPPTSTLPLCNVAGNVVTGIKNGSCDYIASNSDAAISCFKESLIVNGTINGYTSASRYVSKSAKIDDIEFKCP